MKKKDSNEQLINKVMEKKRMTKAEAEVWLTDVLLSNKELESIAGGRVEKIDQARSGCRTTYTTGDCGRRELAKPNVQKLL